MDLTKDFDEQTEEVAFSTGSEDFAISEEPQVQENGRLTFLF